jgi:hypothetical protein
MMIKLVIDVLVQLADYDADPGREYNIKRTGYSDDQ